MVAERGRGDGLGTHRRRRWVAAAAVAAALCSLAPTVPTLAAAAAGDLPAGGATEAVPPAPFSDLPGPFAGPYSEPLGRPYAEPMSAPVAASPYEQSRIERYWSADRRARAQTADAAERGDRPAPSALEGAATAGEAQRDATPPPPSTGAPYVYGGLATKTVGRLFTTLRGVDYACSATVVSSPGRDLAVTAGHCLHQGTGDQFATNVVFMPGYSEGRMPYGLWTARRITVTPGWGLDGDFDYDTGFVLFNARGGRHVEDVVGAQRIAFNQPRTFAQYAFGYPRLAPYDGNRLVYCAGAPSPDPYGTVSLGLNCDMTGGASGGPLIIGLGRAGPGAGWVDSVVSYAYVGESQTIYGTYFGRAIELLYYQAMEL
ncbi:serine protease [Parafrankia sp. BMG5.11]|uniref:trypsin-like serine peptidase n=1 Tax=Parafrankia sp. BMG5.11 TaxID=222540 RepID=UPI00103AE686|nr:hypothetical protein [Parafrankia sp. BMG5.11]TCJ36882.1 hypothetical protein E0504_21640 [Parafrankia sp. BMG5.11]